MSISSTLDASVLIEHHPTLSYYKVGILTLNSEKTLNALSLGMVESLLAILNQWKNDDSIAVIVIQGAGEKAFCAGGDIVKLYESIKTATENPQDHSGYAETFFSREYQLDYLLHTYPKPILCWGKGFIMGGGLGIFEGASHRVVTETARIAMPEITIGLFPDVGGSYFLNQMPDYAGLYVALTGSWLNATDVLFGRLADFFILSEDYPELIKKLESIHWSGDPGQNHSLLTSCLKKHVDQANSKQPAGQLSQHLAYINTLVEPGDSALTLNRILNQSAEKLATDRWLQKGVDTLKKGSPTTAHLIFQQLQKGKNANLEYVFEMERRMAIHCCRKGEFQEGVRALLIDKDGAPQWRYPDFSQVPEDWIKEYFTLPE